MFALGWHRRGVWSRAMAADEVRPRGQPKWSTFAGSSRIGERSDSLFSRKSAYRMRKGVGRTDCLQLPRFTFQFLSCE